MERRFLERVMSRAGKNRSLAFLGGGQMAEALIGGLLAVQTNLKAKLDSMSNMQQHETLRTQMMNSKRLECLTAISNLLEAANNCKKEILRNLG